MTKLSDALRELDCRDDHIDYLKERDAKVRRLLLIPYNQIRTINSFKECKGILNKSERHLKEALVLLEEKEK